MLNRFEEYRAAGHGPKPADALRRFAFVILDRIYRDWEWHELAIHVINQLARSMRHE